ncbi:TadE family type IV pilus minor pilin [Pseudonocardia acidicola]|uniref:Pilus assembly protein n=1 Tax=Pseudonocardia acidicola TaxID=2724939 RepID=A0ABX1SK78_9PSEU|nr:TadE family type IV pilus minor pilin [Pseudonocardia acidicola]NMI01253.1 pilus assembly protein [Pseudonocardia acidicola]
MDDRADRGAVTVEAAVALGTLAVVTVAALGSVATVASSIRCVDAARELARLAARGEPDRGRSIAAELAPSTATIELTVSGDEVTAVVNAAPIGLLPLRVSGRAVAVLEPGVTGAVPG